MQSLASLRGQAARLGASLWTNGGTITATGDDEPTAALSYTLRNRTDKGYGQAGKSFRTCISNNRNARSKETVCGDGCEEHSTNIQRIH